MENNAGIKIALIIIKKYQRGSNKMLPELETMIKGKREIFSEAYLESKIRGFKKTGKGIDELIRIISLVAYRYPMTFLDFSEDESSDFYAFFFPRIRKMIFAYREMGSSFRSYLYTVMRLQVRVFLRERRNISSNWSFHKNQDTARIIRDFTPFLTFQPEGFCDLSFVNFFELDAEGKIKDSVTRRHFFYYLLKSWYMIPDEDLSELSRLLGVPIERIVELRKRIADYMSRHDERKRTFRNRRNRAYYKLILLEQKLETAIEPDEIKRVKERIERLKQTIRASQNRLARINPSPPNWFVGRLLGIPKGTVDSALFSFRHKIDNMSKEMEKLPA